MSTSLQDPLLCSDFSQFMSRLKEARLIDDRIIHELNTTIPTKSFSQGVDIGGKCKSLHTMVKNAHSSRNDSIRRCIDIQVNKTKKLLEEREKDPESFKIKKQLGREQSTLRLFQQELNIEEIVQERAQTAFYERCREYYRAEAS